MLKDFSDDMNTSYLYKTDLNTGVPSTEEINSQNTSGYSIWRSHIEYYTNIIGLTYLSTGSLHVGTTRTGNQITENSEGHPEDNDDISR